MAKQTYLLAQTEDIGKNCTQLAIDIENNRTDQREINARLVRNLHSLVVRYHNLIKILEDQEGENDQRNGVDNN
ncbi:MAG: hypothetical protein JKY86_07695 [Gammaproteobacteria bacterium]|nr:hypothetical protein [Gammaproteobacteria bacterium]MBL4572942.1 hypothetical protein [Gammaproteobacteria bacterium]